MSDKDDKEAAFKELRKEHDEWLASDEYQEYRARTEADHALRTTLFEQLQEEIPGLVIHQWGGSMPVQGFGRLGDDYWYFRFRHNSARIIVGPYDEEIESFLYRRDYRRYIQRLNDHQNENPLFLGTKPRKALPTDLDYYPYRVTRVATREGENPDDGYRGTLDAVEAYDFLKSMLENLKEVPEDEQVPDHIQDGLSGSQPK